MNDHNRNELNKKKSLQGGDYAIMALLGAYGLWAIGVLVMMIMSHFVEPVEPVKPNLGVKQYLGSMNGGQQAYYSDKKEFTNDLKQLDLLGLEIPRETENFFYVMRATESAAFNYAIPRMAKAEELSIYVGGVFAVKTAESETLTITCRSTRPGQVLPAEPQMENGVPTCGTGTEPL